LSGIGLCENGLLGRSAERGEAPTTTNPLGSVAVPSLRSC
jgi:hypothetical protein